MYFVYSFTPQTKLVNLIYKYPPSSSIPPSETNMSAETDGSPPCSFDYKIAQDTGKQSNDTAVIDVTMENGEATPGANGGAPAGANCKAVFEFIFELVSQVIR